MALRLTGSIDTIGGYTASDAFVGTASYATTASNALTASYALNAGGGGGGETVDTGSLLITSSITGLTQSFTKGDGTTYTNLLPSTSSFVKSVNGVPPNSAGNVAVAIGSVETGVSSSGNFPASADDADIFIVSGETGSNSGSNGKAYIYSTSSAEWFEITSPTRVEDDARYVQLAGSTMAGALILNSNPTANLGAATKQYVDGFLETASFANDTLTFIKGDASTFDVAIANTASLLTTSSISGLTQSFTKGDGSTYENYITNAESASYIDGVFGGINFKTGFGGQLSASLGGEVTFEGQGGLFSQVSFGEITYGVLSNAAFSIESITLSEATTLTPNDPLPASPSTGALATSGSPAELFMYNGNGSYAGGWNKIQFV